MKDRGRKKDNKSIIEARISEMIGRVPAFENGFFTFDQLQTNSKKMRIDYARLFETGFAKLETIGYSTEGRPIELLKIGNGRKKALWFGTPHPNELIGTLTTDFLAGQLCANPEITRMLDTTFLIIKSVDPDGMVLNEGWFKRELSPLNYALNFYRPKADEQPEWSFPIEYEPGVSFDTPLPETKAIMKVIENYKPDFMYSLHNNGLSGAYFYLSRPIEALYPNLEQIVSKNNIPLHHGSQEVPWGGERLADGVFSVLKAINEYNYLKSEGKAPTDSFHGASSVEFLQQNSTNPFVLAFMCEVPYFTVDVISNTTSTDRALRDVVREGLDESERILNLMTHHLDELRGKNKLPDSRLSRSVTWYVSYVLASHRAEKQELNDSKYDRSATVAETFNALNTPKFYAATFFGEIYRLAMEAGDKQRAEEIRQEIKAIMDSIQEYSPIKTLPLQNLVRLQLETGLTAMQYVRPAPSATESRS